jgi:hypothetical protein
MEASTPRYGTYAEKSRCEPREIEICTQEKQSAIVNEKKFQKKIKSSVAV